MTSASDTGRPAAKTIARLRSSSMGALTMLVLQFVLGAGVSIYCTVSHGGIGKAFSNGALLGIHAVLGLLLIIAAVDLLVRAILARHRVMIITSAVGLVAIIGAAVNGISFLKNGADGASLGMAVATGVAMLSYGFSLRILGSASGQTSGPAAGSAPGSAGERPASG
ncbi:MAG TPA: hypothetical protein VGL63_13275 [Streptosporangiaceae bacterium]|jgi:hypothetical protein